MAAFADLFTFPLRASHFVELVNPLWATHTLQARVAAVRDETGNARTLTLRPGLGWRRHRAGQHVRLGVPVDGRHYTRTYTISSAPERDDGCFTITAKAIAGGRVSHHLVRKVRAGDYLSIGLPQGDFHLPDAQTVKPLFITAGSGITPAMSMLRSLAARERMPDAVHIHYAPRESDVIFGNELRELALAQALYELRLVFTQEQQGSRGHFSAGQIELLCADWREREVYACGPPALLAALDAHFAEAGRTRHLHSERFLATFSEVPKDAVGGTVRFVKANQTAKADGHTPLLRVAEDAGMNPPHGCRMGICHTCSCKLVSGCVRDLRTGKIINEPGSPVQTCVSAAAGDCELEL